MMRVAAVLALILVAGCDDGGDGAAEFPAESGAKYEGWAKCNTEPHVCPEGWLCKEARQRDTPEYWTCIEPLDAGEDCSDWPGHLSCRCRTPPRETAQYCIGGCEEIVDRAEGIVQLRCQEGFTCAEYIAENNGPECWRDEHVQPPLFVPVSSRPLE